MKSSLIFNIQNKMMSCLSQSQFLKLTQVLVNELDAIDVMGKNSDSEVFDNFELLGLFLSAKKVEGCSLKTIKYYKSTIEKLLVDLDKSVDNISTDDLRNYLSQYKKKGNVSKTTVDNLRRIFSSFFSWLEDENYILKNPVKRIHRVKKGRVVKETLSDEEIETLRDNCDNLRDFAILDLLVSTGMRVGELVSLNIADINFEERECVVFGKGESERLVYFDARTKLHLLEYLKSRADNNCALFVSFRYPHNRLGISGVEKCLKRIGEKSSIVNVHPHKFRRTLATNAIDKGMPVEQVQKLLGHMQLDMTMQYAMVQQNNVKIAHRKFIS